MADSFNFYINTFNKWRSVVLCSVVQQCLKDLWMLMPMTLSISLPVLCSQRAIGKFASALVALPKSVIKLPKTVLQYIIRATKVSERSTCVICSASILVFVHKRHFPFHVSPTTFLLFKLEQKITTTNYQFMYETWNGNVSTHCDICVVFYGRNGFYFQLIIWCFLHCMLMVLWSDFTILLLVAFTTFIGSEICFMCVDWIQTT